MTLPRPLRLALLGLASVLALLCALAYGLTWHPAERAAATAGCSAPAPVLQPGQALKVLTWNLRHLGGDAAGGLAPSLDELARVLREEHPDVVLLQGLHDGAQTRDRQDPLALLQARLDERYPCSSQAFYWKAPLTLQPPRLGRIGLKLATLSRYHIESAERVQLPRRPGNPLLQAFAARPALLVSYLPMRGGGRLAAINTQLDAFAPGMTPSAASWPRPSACSRRCRMPARSGCSAATSTGRRPARKRAGRVPMTAHCAGGPSTTR
ncbi:endonuclease/exonuclease/phosphatase family protein [Pseudomonas benzenivorans]|uniref:endonuclease/exonuclease/phosphatase family protein n=1 Tax=Pseudomonas benzenivorans TaxID=556533 RepID=UPI0035119C47